MVAKTAWPYPPEQVTFFMQSPQMQQEKEWRQFHENLHVSKYTWLHGSLRSDFHSAVTEVPTMHGGCQCLEMVREGSQQSYCQARTLPSTGHGNNSWSCTSLEHQHASNQPAFYHVSKYLRGASKHQSTSPPGTCTVDTAFIPSPMLQSSIHPEQCFRCVGRHAVPCNA